MDEQIITKLKYFYELETFQIAYYTSQLSSNEDKFYHKAFTTMAQVEQKHADYFAKKLMEANVELPKIGLTLADFAGGILGESIELTGPANACKIGVALENRALEAYHNFINVVREDSELGDKLIEFILEEEFHTLWLNSYASRLKQKESINTITSTNVEDHPTINVNMNWI